MDPQAYTILHSTHETVKAAFATLTTESESSVVQRTLGDVSIRLGHAYTHMADALLPPTWRSSDGSVELNQVMTNHWRGFSTSPDQRTGAIHFQVEDEYLSQTAITVDYEDQQGPEELELSDVAKAEYKTDFITKQAWVLLLLLEQISDALGAINETITVAKDPTVRYVPSYESSNHHWCVNAAGKELMTELCARFSFFLTEDVSNTFISALHSLSGGVSYSPSVTLDSTLLKATAAALH